MTNRNVYMTDELEAIYDQVVDFVTNEVTPHGEQWEHDGKVPRDVLRRPSAKHSVRPPSPGSRSPRWCTPTWQGHT